MQTHLKILGVLYIVVGFKNAFWCLCFLLAMAGISFVPASLFGGPLVGLGTAAVVGILGLLMVMFTILIPALQIAGGVGLLQGERWARYLVLVLAGISLLHFSLFSPLRLALVIYTLWVVLKIETSREDPSESYRYYALD
jgi:hypothetical protein